jgi:hypothetical protein
MKELKRVQIFSLEEYNSVSNDAIFIVSTVSYSIGNEATVTSLSIRVIYMSSFGHT